MDPGEYYDMSQFHRHDQLLMMLPDLDGSGLCALVDEWVEVAWKDGFEAGVNDHVRPRDEQAIREGATVQLSEKQREESLESIREWADGILFDESISEMDAPGAAQAITGLFGRSQAWRQWLHDRAKSEH